MPWKSEHLRVSPEEGTIVHMVVLLLPGETIYTSDRAGSQMYTSILFTLC